LGTLHESVLSLLAPNGQTLLAQSDEVSPGNLASRIAWQAPAAGTYYLAVMAYPNAGAGTYSLQLSLTGPPPTIGAVADQTLPQGGSLLVGLQGSDPNGQAISYTAQAVGVPAGTVAVSLSGNFLSVRPAATFSGRFQVQVGASDSLAASTSSFWVTVTAPAANSGLAAQSIGLSPLSQPAASLGGLAAQSIGLSLLPRQAATLAAAAASVDQAMASGSWAPSNRPLDLAALETLYALWGPA
jgi:hypothetical protein